MNFTVHNPTALEWLATVDLWILIHPVYTTLLVLWLGLWLGCSRWAFEQVRQEIPHNPWWWRALLVLVPALLWLLTQAE